MNSEVSAPEVDHEGSAALAEYILRTEPAAVLCGHLHISGAARVGRTLVRVIYGVELFEHCRFGGFGAGI
ncbi:MAG: hypothetical protein ACPLQO_12815 [Desulfotomaculales bacterium]